VNAKHLEVCGSGEWAKLVRERIMPWILAGPELGDDVLEIKPEPGRTTEVLRDFTAHLTAVELDEALASVLAARLAGSNV
jgi:16S rRNA A1518/A1519 N6-dimethyltransferase RsmA/KsgA/DIM1 with predicted DNA glycosylase/AP lyase activity